MKYKKNIFILAGICISMSIQAAAAADLYIKVPDPVPFEPGEPMPVIGYDWDRFYGGVFVGRSKGPVTVSNDFGLSLFDTTLDMSSNLTGFTIGKNFQLNDGKFVLGIEGDIASMKWSASGTHPYQSLLIDLGDSSYDIQVDRFATLRGRVGMPLGVERKVLPYFTAGLTAIRAEASGAIGSSTPVYSNSAWVTGYAVGAGVETALTDRLTFKAEYLYSEFSKSLDLVGEAPFGTASFEFNHVHQVRAGLNVHF